MFWFPLQLCLCIEGIKGNTRYIIIINNSSLMVGCPCQIVGAYRKINSHWPGGKRHSQLIFFKRKEGTTQHHAQLQLTILAAADA